MADSRREVILQTVNAALEATGVPEGLTFHRHRTRRLEQESLPAGVIFNGIERITRQTTQPPIMDRELTFRVELRAIGEPSDVILDPYLSWVEQQVTTDPALLAIIRQVKVQQVVWDQEPAKRPAAAAAIEFVIEYRTQWGDPTSSAP